MAGSTIPEDNTLSSLGSLGSLISAITPSTSTTQNSGISSTGLNQLLTQLLSSTNGLAAVAGGQNTAGLYNSTVQQAAVNQLLTETAGEVAEKGPTSSTTTKTPDIGQTLLQGGLGLLGTSILSPVLKGAESKLGINSIGQSLANALGLGGNSTAAGTGAAIGSGSTPFTLPAGSVAGDAASAVTGTSVGAASGIGAAGADSLGAALGGSTALDAAAAGDVAGSAAGLGGIGAGLTGAGAVGTGIGAGLTGAGALSSSLAGSLGLDAAATGAVTGSAAGLGGIGAGLAGSAAADSGAIAAAGADALGGAAAGGGIGDALAAIGTALAWVVCTELESVGEMSHSTYTQAAPDFIARMKLKPSAVRGYHYWAIPYTRMMRRKDWIGKVFRAVMKPIANGRAEYILGNKNFCGWISFYLIEPICSLLGNTVARKPQNWKSLYSQEK